MNTTMISAVAVARELDQDLPLSALVGTDVPRTITGMRKVELSESEREFSPRYHEELSVLSLQKDGRKLTQGERIDLYMSMKEADGTLPTSKLGIVAGELAAYHRWPVFMVALTEKCTKYTYKSGLWKDRTYREIDPLITEWVYAK